MEYKLEKMLIPDDDIRALNAKSVVVDMTECLMNSGLVMLRIFELVISGICSCRYGG